MRDSERKKLQAEIESFRAWAPIVVLTMIAIMFLSMAGDDKKSVLACQKYPVVLNIEK